MRTALIRGRAAAAPPPRTPQLDAIPASPLNDKPPYCASPLPHATREREPGYLDTDDHSLETRVLRAVDDPRPPRRARPRPRRTHCVQEFFVLQRDNRGFWRTHVPEPSKHTSERGSANTVRRRQRSVFSRKPRHRCRRGHASSSAVAFAVTDASRRRAGDI
ncbi:hypothetical protein EVAR_35200_1 [Eumeta japonica]|uniref:Uncharacterized protein n=1 Tax=Eumeta variegata TaxID=151549 RepID=A0A4C1VEF4_EUMVA|nr:hypothetical protein EVAR_35200_1 [Eumeta japonica]